VSTMRCHLLTGLMALALQQCWAVANILGRANKTNATQTVAKQVPKTTPEKPIFNFPTYANMTLYAPDPMVGSVHGDDTRFTLQVVIEGFESSIEKFKKANARLQKMSCKELDDERQAMDDAWEKYKHGSLMATFEAARANAKKAKAMDHQKEQISASRGSIADATAKVNQAAKKGQADYINATMQHLNVLEQYALKCGVRDKWCVIGDSGNNKKFEKLQISTQGVDAVFTEAGWLRNQANGEYSTEADKKSAEIRWGTAMMKVGEVWADRASLGWGIEVTTAACGLLPPSGPWAKGRDKCNLIPSDPMMQALLRDDPQEFIRHYKEIIGKKAGITPDKVVVDISGCF